MQVNAWWAILDSVCEDNGRRSKLFQSHGYRSSTRTGMTRRLIMWGVRPAASDKSRTLSRVNVLTIIDRDHDTAAGGLVNNAHARCDWQRAMGGGVFLGE